MTARGNLDFSLGWRQIAAATMVVVCLTGSRGRAEEVVIQARDLSNRSENVAPEYPQFGNLTLCVGKQGSMAWSSQVLGGSYHLHFLYCSGEQRPCELSVNGRCQPTRILGSSTGGFMPTHLTWETWGPFELAPGRNEISISAAGFMPHLKALVISTDEQPPAKDEIAGPNESLSRRQLQSQLHSLIAAITDLRARYSPDYSRADLYLTRSRALLQELQRGEGHEKSLLTVNKKLEDLRYQALVLDNPLLGCGKLLFIRRYTYQSSHYYTDYMEVQRMRTFVNLRPGETRACIGCHQDRNQAPSSGYLAALRQTPCDLVPQPGDTAPRPIHYPSDVQPLLDKHCVRCHNAESAEGDIDLSGEMTELFCQSYETLVGRDWVKVWRENEPKTGDASPLPAYALGSHASRLIQLLRNGHEGVYLSPAEMISLVTWIDANAPYYGSYFGRRNLTYRDHPDFRPVPTLEPTDYGLR